MAFKMVLTEKAFLFILFIRNYSNLEGSRNLFVFFSIKNSFKYYRFSDTLTAFGRYLVLRIRFLHEISEGMIIL